MKWKFEKRLLRMRKERALKAAARETAMKNNRPVEECEEDLDVQP